jgi:hypothetical protein
MHHAQRQLCKWFPIALFTAGNKNILRLCFHVFHINNLFLSRTECRVEINDADLYQYTAHTSISITWLREKRIQVTRESYRCQAAFSLPYATCGARTLAFLNVPCIYFSLQTKMCNLDQKYGFIIFQHHFYRSHKTHTIRALLIVSCDCILCYTMSKIARGSVVGWGTMLQAGRSRVRIPMRWIF